MATLEALQLDRIVWASMVQVQKESTKGRAWSEAEDQFLRDNLATLTDAEIGEQLGRSETAVHLRWSRDLHLPSRSKDPSVLTGRRAAEMLGIENHKISGWMDMGLIPGHLMPGKRIKFHTIHLVDRQAFRRWVLNPANWVYFNPKKVRDPELKRMLKLRSARWGDEWWTTRQVADYHGVDPKDVERYIKKLGRLHSFHLPVSLGGRQHNRAWSNHFVLKSEAIQVRFHKGQGNHKPCLFTPAADAWLLKARDQLGMTFVHIGRTMKIGSEKKNHKTGTSISNPTIAYRYHLLKAMQKKKGAHR
jgi:hypothetical protein